MKEIVIEIIAGLLIVMWFYATVSKLMDIRLFKLALLSQAFPPWVGRILFWILPVFELAAAILLIFEKTRLEGMCLSFIMMLLFTLYVAGAVLDIFIKYPCACGGIFRRMNWRTHLIFNLVYTLIALVGIVLMSC